uniref:SAWADEE domain-containing protein n=1 Tax=Steinernema glaseri TaxID=37863 RepID=A0A1I7XZG9_9BILA
MPSSLAGLRDHLQRLLVSVVTEGKHRSGAITFSPGDASRSGVQLWSFYVHFRELLKTKMSTEGSLTSSKHALPRIDWENPKVDAIVDLVRKGEVSTRAAARKLSILLHRKVSHTTMQRRANFGGAGGVEEKPVQKVSKKSPPAKQVEEPVRSGETVTSATSERMDPFVDKQWLERSSECESYRILPSPHNGEASTLEVWISQDRIRRYRACGRRGNVTHFRCTTCDELGFNATQSGRTISVKEGRVIGFLCPKHDLQCVPLEEPSSELSERFEWTQKSNGRKRPHPGDPKPDLSNSPHCSLSPDVNESNQDVRQSPSMVDWDSVDVQAVVISANMGEITVQQAAEKLSTLCGQSVVPSDVEKKLEDVGMHEDEEEANKIVVDDTLDSDEDVSLASIMALQNSQILAVLQAVVGGIASMREELTGIRGALTDLRSIFLGFAHNNSNTSGDQ